jgi:hypothetical protein
MVYGQREKHDQGGSGIQEGEEDRWGACCRITSEKGNLSLRTVLTSRKAERLRRSDQARFPQEGQDRMSHFFCVGGS